MTQSSRAGGGGKRLASIDIGTNSVLLLVVEAAGDELRSVVNRAVITRLGRDVDRTGHLDVEASRRTLDCLRSYAAELDELGVDIRQAVGTSALRDAAGGEDFLDRAERVLGTRPRVLSGREEAELSFVGAVSGLNLLGTATVFDVGGGSTEVISGRAGPQAARILSATSVNLGAVRLHERHVKHDPPLEEEMLTVQQDVREHLPEAAPYGESSFVVGVAGTVTALLAISRRMDVYEGERVHAQRLSQQQIVELSKRLAQMSLKERCEVPGLDPRRADVIVTGTVIVLELLDWLRAATIIVSDRGLRWGLVEKLVQRERE